MTTPEAAMTREQVLGEALRKYGGHLVNCPAHPNPFKGSVPQGGWEGPNLSLYTEDCRCGFAAALASAQQEPAPAADAEEVTREIKDALSFFRSVIQSGESWTDICELRYHTTTDRLKALRRYAGDGGVRDAEWPYEVWQAGASKWHELDLEAKRLNSVIGTRVDMLKFIWAAMKVAAARASGEKGGADV